MDLIELMQQNNHGDVFDSTAKSIKTVKRGWKFLKNDDCPLTSIDFSVGQFAYVAQRITGSKGRPKQRGYWLNRAKAQTKALNLLHSSAGRDELVLTLLDPWEFNLSSLIGVTGMPLEPCVDYALVAASNVVIMDFVRGVSFGTTCEIMCANTRGVPVLGVYQPDQQLSLFTNRHVTKWAEADYLADHVDYEAITVQTRNPKLKLPKRLNATWTDKLLAAKG